MSGTPLVDTPAPTHPDFVRAWTALTQQQRRAVRLRCRGLGNQAAAAELGISDNSVKNHLTAVFRKMIAAGAVAPHTADMAHICRHYGYAQALQDVERQAAQLARSRHPEEQR